MKKRRRQGPGCLRGLILLLAMGLVLASLLLVYPAYREPKVQGPGRQAFIEAYAPLAQRTGKTYGLYPSMVLGQAALESNFGQSKLSKLTNNYFGIKATKGRGQAFTTREVEGGQDVYVKENFASYPSAKASFKAYGKLLSKAPRYERVREASSLDEALSLLHPCGYSTDPTYGAKVKALIDRYNLTQYD